MKKFALALAAALLLPLPAFAGGYLGVYMTEDRPQQGGALVEEVAPNSPAAQAGLRKGDMIVACNGAKTPTTKAFITHLTKANGGDTLELRVERDGWGKTVRITLGQRPGASAQPERPRPPMRVPQERGFLGVFLRQGPNGEAVIDGTQPGSAAAKAGLQSGDVVRKVNGAIVTEPAAMAKALGESGVGDAVELEIQRGGRTMSIKAVLGARTDSQRPNGRPAQPAPAPEARPGAKQPPYIGVALDDAGGQGPLTVDDVAPNSPAEKFGLRKGDIVLAVGDADLSTVEQFVKAMEGKFAGDTIALRIQRDGWRSNVRVTLGQRPQGE